MAIEFHCPYCTALIRVPDNAGGGKGKCPKCATRLTVPKVSASKPATSKPAAPPPAETAALFTAPSAEESPFAGMTAPPVVDDGAFAFAEADPDVSAEPDETVPFGFPETHSPQAAATSPHTARPAIRPKRSLIRKLGRGLWLVPVTIALALGGVVGWYAWQHYQSEQLGGELIAETADELELPPALIEKSSIKQPSDDVQAVLVDLEKSPVPLLSSLMQVQLRGSNRGVLVQLSVGQSARFYRVEVGDNKPLAKYLAKHAADFEQRRMKEIERTAAAFAIQYRKVIAKKDDQSSLTEFRNTLALPALVRGLGYHVAATHGRTIYPCVYEDHEGALYFLLPPDAKSFEISGRVDDDKTVIFPGRYKVNVAGMMKVPAKKDEDATGKSKDKKSKAKPGPVFKRSDEPAEMKDSQDEAAMKKGE